MWQDVSQFYCIKWPVPTGGTRTKIFDGLWQRMGTIHWENQSAMNVYQKGNKNLNCYSQEQIIGCISASDNTLLTRQLHRTTGRKNKRGFPLDQLTICFEFPEISIGEWNNIFRNIGKRGQPGEVYTNFGKFLSGNFPNFRLNGSHFGASTSFGFSENLPRKLPYNLSPFRKFRNVGLNGKHPRLNFFIFICPFYPQFHQRYTTTTRVHSLTDRAVASANLVAIWWQRRCGWDWDRVTRHRWWHCCWCHCNIDSVLCVIHHVLCNIDRVRRGDSHCLGTICKTKRQLLGYLTSWSCIFPASYTGWTFKWNNSSSLLFLSFVFHYRSFRSYPQLIIVWPYSGILVFPNNKIFSLC